ncbi:MAG TPA: hypothetical protein VGF76_06590 [Polyangiaceae bacterium]
MKGARLSRMKLASWCLALSLAAAPACGGDAAPGSSPPLSSAGDAAGAAATNSGAGETNSAGAAPTNSGGAGPTNNGGAGTANTGNPSEVSFAGGSAVSIGGGTPSSPTECNALAASLAQETPRKGACTALVRLDFRTLRVLGHSLVCGPYQTTDLAAASAVSTAVAHPATPYGSVSGDAPHDEFILRGGAGDFLSASGVSARSGLLLFTASLDFYPLMTPPDEVGSPSGTFNDATKAWVTGDLGTSCTPLPSLPGRGIDLRAPSTTPAQFPEAANVVLTSALPQAFASWGSLQDVMVVAFPGQGPVAGPTAYGPPPSAEYIVLLNGGNPR